MLLKRIMEYGKMIKFSHSVFALPFALSAAVMANRISELTLNKLIWIIVAMVSARSAAMGFNRLVDKKYDALNPRTNGRHLPTGKIQERDIVIFVVLSSLIFIWSAFMLNWLCFYLSPVALATIFLYSYKLFALYSGSWPGYFTNRRLAGGNRRFCAGTGYFKRGRRFLGGGFRYSLCLS